MKNSLLPPIAKVIENINCAVEESDKFDNVVYLYEVIIKTLASIMFCRLRTIGINEDRIDQIISTEFAKPSVGSWNKLLRECLIFINEKENKIFESFFEKYNTYQKIVRAYNEMNQAVSLKVSNKSMISLEMLFDTFISFRNKLTSAHGAPNLETKKYFSLILNESIVEVMENFRQFFECGFIMFNQVIIDENNRNNAIHKGVRFLGNNREPIEIVRSVLKTFEQNKIYCDIIKENLINLYPFLLMRSMHFYFMNGISGKKMEYLSYSTGERFFEDMETDDFQKYLRVNALTISFYEHKIQTQLSEAGVVHNLPRLDFDFIGRNNDIEKLFDTISHRRHSIIALDGIGGVGKTAITLKIASELLRLPKNHKNRFNYIIWVSAKQTRLTIDGIEKVEASFGLLDDLLNLIANVSGFEYLTNESLDDKREAIKEILALDSFLIIIDNFETVKESKDIWTFLRDELPMPSMSIITSRNIFAEVSRLIEIRQMLDDDAKDLILNEAKRLDLKSLLSSQHTDIDKIIQRTGAIPLAIKQIIGHMALGKSLTTALKDLTSVKGNILDFCFNESYDMMDNNCKEIFLTIAKVEKPIRKDGLEMVSSFRGENLDDQISKLLKMSLIDVTFTDDGTQIFNMLPLTEEFALKKLELEPDIYSRIFKRLEDFEELHRLNYMVASKELELTNIEKMVQAALTYASRRNFERADHWFAKACEIETDNTYVLLNKAQYEQYFKLDYNAARDSYIKLTSLKKDDYLAWFHWGMMEKQQDNLSEAINKFDRVLDINPSHISSYHGKGDCLLKLGIKRKEASKQLKGKDGQKASSLLFEARNYLRDSIECLKKGFYEQPQNKTELHHNTVNHHALSVAFTRTGDMDNALIQCNNGLLLEPFNKKLKELQQNIEKWRVENDSYNIN